MKSLTAILAPPLLCAGVLVGIAVQKSTHVKPKDAEAYHAAVKAAISELDYTVGDNTTGIWVGKDIEPTKAAVELLRPNIILSRQYSNTRGDPSRHWANTCNVLIVQCWDSRDMVGHYPENCYVNGGDTLVAKRPRELKVGDWTIDGTEYTFERFSNGQPNRRCVYNFLVVPRKGRMAIVPDIQGLNKAAEDYQWRYFGAAQFQFVMSADVTRDKRDEVFRTIIGSNLGMFTALNNLDVQ